MRCYRLCRAPFRAIDGEGARLYGGRWNRPGRPVVYTSGSLALAALEYLVHVDPADVPADLLALTLEVPDHLEVQALDAATLPSDWMHYAAPAACQSAGAAWLAAGETAMLRVPSAPVPEEWNLLLNPRHPDAAQMKVVAERPFVFDPRLLR